MSKKGRGLKILAAVISMLLLGTGVLTILYQSTGSEKTSAVIVSINNDLHQHIIKAEYTINGKKYNSVLDSDNNSLSVGDKIEIRYDPKDPKKIHSGTGFGFYLIITGGVILLFAVFITVKEKISQTAQKEKQTDISRAPPDHQKQ